MTRLNLTFAEDAPPEPAKAWPTPRVLMWALLFATLSMWIGLTLIR